MPLESLTEREFEVLGLVARGARNREIASLLSVSIKTIEFHLSKILSKLEAKSRTEAALHAWQAGLLDLSRSPVQIERSIDHDRRQPAAVQPSSAHGKRS
jgi:DNA-binding CsgD family transcriptional regulator